MRDDELQRLRDYGTPRTTHDVVEYYACRRGEDPSDPPVRARIALGVQELYRRGFTNPASLSLTLGVPPVFIVDLLSILRGGELERLQYVDLMRADLVIELEGIQRELWNIVEDPTAQATLREKALRALAELVERKAKILGLHEAKVTVTNKREVELKSDDPEALQKLMEAAGVSAERIRDFAENAAGLLSTGIDYGT